MASLVRAVFEASILVPILHPCITSALSAGSTGLSVILVIIFIFVPVV